MTDQERRDAARLERFLEDPAAERPPVADGEVVGLFDLLKGDVPLPAAAWDRIAQDPPRPKRRWRPALVALAAAALLTAGAGLLLSSGSAADGVPSPTVAELRQAGAALSAERPAAERLATLSRVADANRQRLVEVMR